MIVLIFAFIFVWALYEFFKSVQMFISEESQASENFNLPPEERIIKRNIKYPNYSKKQKSQNSNNQYQIRNDSGIRKFRIN